MSTIRKLRRTMVTQHQLSGPQKPHRKIADLPEDERRLIRCLIKQQLETADVQRVTGLNLDAAAQYTEKLIDAGKLPINFYNSPENSSHFISALYGMVADCKH